MTIKEKKQWLTDVRGTLINYIGDESNVIIPSSIKRIDARAFSKPNNLESVIIPGSVKIIGRNSFESNRIKNLILLDGVEEIHENAFTNNMIETLILPSSLRKIGTGSFDNNNITKLVVPNINNLKKIRGNYNELFQNKNKSTSLSFDNLKDLIEYAFWCNPIETIVVLSKCEDEAFYTCYGELVKIMVKHSYGNSMQMKNKKI